MYNQKGMTLIELIIVVVIMGLMFILSTTFLTTTTSHAKVKSAARDVATELQMARMKAIYRNMEYRVNLTLTAGTTTEDTYIFQCKKVNAGDTSCSATGSWYADPERLTMSSSAIKIPLAVNVTDTNGNSGTVTVEFNPNGTSSTAGLCFINRDITTSPLDVIKLCVSSSTGRVRTEIATSCSACSS